MEKLATTLSGRHNIYFTRSIPSLQKSISKVYFGLGPSHHNENRERRIRITVGGHCEESVLSKPLSLSLFACGAILAFIFKGPSPFAYTL